jgi:hypothetical protein
MFILSTFVFAVTIGPVGASAETVPWMTGSFPTYDGFNIDGSSADGSYFHLSYLGSFDFGYSNEECHGQFENQVCHEWGSSLFSGPVTGGIYSADGTLIAAFTGSAKGYSKSDRIAGFGYAFITLTANYYFHGDFTNGWGTVGSVGWEYDSSEGTVGGAFLTTRSSTPEPSSISMIGAGVFSLCYRIRRRS